MYYMRILALLFFIIYLLYMYYIIITEEGNYVFVIENGNVASVEKTVAINSNAEIGKRVEYTKKDNYTDAENNKATIPAGFAVSGIEEEQIISKGLVIYEIPEGIEEIDWSEKDSDGIYTVQKQYNQKPYWISKKTMK